MQRSILEKCRELNNILYKGNTGPVDFQEIAQTVSRNLECSVYIIGRRGNVIGYSFHGEEGSFPDADLVVGYAERFPESFNRELLKIRETWANMRMDRRCLFKMKNTSCSCEGRIFAIVPVVGGRRRLGTIVLHRGSVEFSEEDIVVAEYAAVVMANEVLRMRGERIERDTRQRASVKVALATLSHSEREAIRHILSELNSREGLLVASRVADRVGITRSVIASALRKLESAGVIESRSLGMKGTYIKVLSDNLFEELDKD